MSVNTELQTTSGGSVIGSRDISKEDTVPSFPIPFSEIERRLNEVKAFVQSQLQDGEDYGTVPGVTKKFMWLSGAEKVLAAFGWGARIVIEERTEAEANRIACPTAEEARLQKVYVRVRCDIFDKRTGMSLMSKYGSCDSGEYQFRKQLGSVRTKRTTITDPDTGKPVWDHSRCPPGKGLHKKGGRTTCRPKQVVEEDTENPICIHDLMHNIEQRAGKRAFVSATVYAARLGYEFSYDEDLVDNIRDQEVIQAAEQKAEEPKKAAPKKRAAKKEQKPKKAQKEEPEEIVEADTTDTLKGYPQGPEADNEPPPEGLPAKAYDPDNGALLVSQTGIDFSTWSGKTEAQRKADGDCTEAQLRMLGAQISRQNLDPKKLQEVIGQRWPEVKRSWQLSKSNLGEVLDEIMS